MNLLDEDVFERFVLENGSRRLSNVLKVMQKHDFHSVMQLEPSFVLSFPNGGRKTASELSRLQSLIRDMGGFELTSQESGSGQEIGVELGARSSGQTLMQSTDSIGANHFQVIGELHYRVQTPSQAMLELAMHTQVSELLMRCQQWEQGVLAALLQELREGIRQEAWNATDYPLGQTLSEIFAERHLQMILSHLRSDAPTAKVLDDAGLVNETALGKCNLFDLVDLGIHWPLLVSSLIPVKR